MSIPDTPQKYINVIACPCPIFLLTFPRDIIFKEMTSWENPHADHNRTCTLENSFRLLKECKYVEPGFFFFFLGGGVRIKGNLNKDINLDLRVSSKKLQSMVHVHFIVHQGRRRRGGGSGGLCPRTFKSGGAQVGLSPPHFWKDEVF